MLEPIEINGSAIPCMTAVSHAYLAKVVTAREYSSGLRVAALEDSARKLFHKTTWANVQKGDTVLMAWGTAAGDIAEAFIAERARAQARLNGRYSIIVSFDKDGHRFDRWAFRPDETVYVQSRL